MKHKSKTMLLFLGGAALVVFLFFSASNFLAEDGCMDAGGRWVASERTCEGARAGG